MALALGLEACCSCGRRAVQLWPVAASIPCSAMSRRSFATKYKPKGPTTTPTSEERRTLHRRLNVKQPYRQEVLEASPDTLMHAQMYTPEVLKSENLALNCFRMVAFGLHMPELLDRYGERAAELASTLRPDQFSKILTAFARAEHRHEQMLQSFTRHIPARLPQFLPLDLSQTCNAYAKLREREENLFRRLSSEMPHKLPLFEPFQLKNVANAYARLSIRDDLLFDDIADEVLRRPQEFGPVDLYLLANAFATFRIRHPRLWLTLAEWLLQSYLDLNAVHVSVLLNAMSTVGFHHDALLDALMRSLSQEPLLGELDASTLTQALNALARLQWVSSVPADGSSDIVDPSALTVLAERAVVLLPDLDPAGITRLLHACTRLPPLGSHASLVEGLLERAKPHVAEFNAQSLSLLVHCCAALRKRDVPLLTQVAKAVPGCIAEFTPQALAMTAQGFARLEVRSEILFYLLATEAIDKMPLFTGQGVGMLLRAFARLQVQNERLVQACRKQVRALAEELSLAELQMIEGGFRSLGALDGSTDALLRRQRRQLGVAQTAFGAPADPWTTDEERLLTRLAEEPRTVRKPSVAGRHSTGGVFTEPGSEMQPETPMAEDVAKGDQQPDLWTLWGADATGDTGGVKFQERGKASQKASTGPESDVLGGGAGEATPASRLREYLARPERAGRKPVVLGSQAASAEVVNDDSEPEIKTGGRKSRRR
mmetsp:Transcript_78182/g.148564  ORF Transcript_78182/g.148564 Transcript_78182/m.148564 type:complete len:715 (+) Transcript_78182:276-2420(+)